MSRRLSSKFESTIQVAFLEKQLYQDYNINMHGSTMKERQCEKKCLVYIWTQIKLVFPTYANLTFITITMIGVHSENKYLVVGKSIFCERKQTGYANE